MNFSFRLFFLGFLLVAACNSAETPQQREAKIARAFCECTSELTALDQKAAQAVGDSTNQTGLTDLLWQMQAEHNKAKSCLVPTLKAYGRLTPAQITVVLTALQRECPGAAGRKDLLIELMGE